MRRSLADYPKWGNTTPEGTRLFAKACMEWRDGFEADLKALLKIAEDGFNANPHDEYFSWHHGRMDLLQKILGVAESPKEGE